MISFVSLCARVRPRALARLLCSQTHPHTHEKSGTKYGRSQEGEICLPWQILGFFFSSFLFIFKNCDLLMYENVVLVADFVGFCFFCFLGWFHCEERVGGGGGGGSWSCLHFSAISVVHFCRRFGFQKLCNTKEKKYLEFCAYLVADFCCCCFLFFFFCRRLLPPDRQTDRREEEVVVVA
jgi:hypothetical protein